VTCHTAISSQFAAVVIADSQASTDRSESHGTQKLFAGEDFLIGAAGNMAIIRSLFDELQTGSRTNNGVPIMAASLEGCVTRFFQQEVQQAACPLVSILAISPSIDARAVRPFYPGLFRNFSRPTNFSAIGSGAEFVDRARQVHGQLGITFPEDSLADLLIAGEYYANAANESLTVDDCLHAGILIGGRAYLFGDPRIGLTHCNPALPSGWMGLAGSFAVLLQEIQTIRSEFQNVHRVFSALRTGNLMALHQSTLANSNIAIMLQRNNIDGHIQQLLASYDQILGRPQLATPTP
jgi:hypothetical protein